MADRLAPEIVSGNVGRYSLACLSVVDLSSLLNYLKIISLTFPDTYYTQRWAQHLGATAPTGRRQHKEGSDEV
jgi:hypothetical protein